MTITVTTLKDSINEYGDRMYTALWVYPRYIHCFDSKTEILSQICDEIPKFRSFAAVEALGAKVAQYDEVGSITFVLPTHNVVQPAGESKRVVRYRPPQSSRSPKFSMLVTDKHRMYSLKRTTGNKWLPTVDTADTFIGGWVGKRRIPQAGTYAGGSEVAHMPPSEVALVMWFVADGHLPKRGNTAVFHFRKDRKVSEVLKLLNELDIEHKISVYADDTVIRFTPPHWCGSCYDESMKVLPDCIFPLTPEGYEALKEAALLSDGNKASNSYNTGSPILAHQMQAIALLYGDAMNIRSYEGGRMYKQTYQETNYISFDPSLDSGSFIEDSYTGEVRCVTVGSGLVVVRREGVAYVSGNCEVLRHRMLSHSVSSSRAIPVDRMLELIESDPVVPTHWGQAKAGMQAGGEIKHPHMAHRLWDKARHRAISSAKELGALGLHKQVTNRLVEPFQHIVEVVSGTEYNNFLHLRLDGHAQPEICKLAVALYDARTSSIPEMLKAGQYHLPYVDTVWDSEGLPTYTVGDAELCDTEEAIMVSMSAIAQTSYRKLDLSVTTARNIHDKLMGGVIKHVSPSEHIATPFTSDERSGRESLRKSFEDIMSSEIDRGRDSEALLYSGNLKGWHQARKQYVGEHIDYPVPMKTVEAARHRW
jgi:hypothetical protein